MSAVEALTASDADAAAALWKAAGLTRPWNDPHADFDRALAGPTSTVLGLRDGGALVATVMRPAISSVSIVIEASAKIVNSHGPAAITAA